MISKKFFYENSSYVSFKVIDARVSPILYLLPDAIYINGLSVNFTYSNNTVHLTDKVSGTVTLDVLKQGYNTDTSTVTRLTLNNSVISLLPQLQSGNSICKVLWNPASNLDFDSHLLIYENDLLLSDVCWYNQSYTNSNTVVSLDHDDRGSGNHNFGGNETVAILPIYSGYKYILVIVDYNSRESSGATVLSSRNTICKLTIGNINYTITAPHNGESGKFWEVFEIENGIVSLKNILTDTNTYNIVIDNPNNQ